MTDKENHKQRWQIFIQLLDTIILTSFVKYIVTLTFWMVSQCHCKPEWDCLETWWAVSDHDTPCPENEIRSTSHF